MVEGKCRVARGQRDPGRVMEALLDLFSFSNPEEFSFFSCHCGCFVENIRAKIQAG